MITVFMHAHEYRDSYSFRDRFLQTIDVPCISISLMKI